MKLANKQAGASTSVGVARLCRHEQSKASGVALDTRFWLKPSQIARVGLSENWWPKSTKMTDTNIASQATASQATMSSENQEFGQEMASPIPSALVENNAAGPR